MTESRFASTQAWLAETPCQHSIEYPAWLAFAEERKHLRAAADWAVYELAAAGLVSVVWPLLDQKLSADIRGRLYQGTAERYRGGRSPTVADWDFFEQGRILEIRSTPRLWQWWQAGEKDGRKNRLPAGQPSPSATRRRGRPPADPKRKAADIKLYRDWKASRLTKAAFLRERYQTDEDQEEGSLSIGRGEKHVKAAARK